MSEPLIVQTLKQKRAEILGQIKAYEAQIAHASRRAAWHWRPAPAPIIGRE